MGKYMITRKQYKEIKKYDHGQMEDYLKDVYTLGYANGKEDAITALAEDKIEDYQKNVEQAEAIEEKLKAVKGIGEAKLKAVMDVVLNVLNVEEADSED